MLTIYWILLQLVYRLEGLLAIFDLKDCLDPSEDADELKRLLPERALWQICHDISCGLFHIHFHGMVHYDIKPSNIFFVCNVCLGTISWNPSLVSLIRSMFQPNSNERPSAERMFRNPRRWKVRETSFLPWIQGRSGVIDFFLLPYIKIWNILCTIRYLTRSGHFGYPGFIPYPGSDLPKMPRVEKIQGKKTTPKLTCKCVGW